MIRRTTLSARPGSKQITQSSTKRYTLPRRDKKRPRLKKPQRKRRRWGSVPAEANKRFALSKLNAEARRYFAQ